MHNVPVWEDILKQWVTFYTNCSKPIFPTGSVITNCLCVFYIWIMEPQMAVRLGHLDMNVQARMFVSQKKLTIPDTEKSPSLTLISLTTKYDFLHLKHLLWGSLIAGWVLILIICMSLPCFLFLFSWYSS